MSVKRSLRGFLHDDGDALPERAERGFELIESGAVQQVEQAVYHAPEPPIPSRR